MSKLIAGVLCAGLVVAMAVPATAAEPGPDVTICHVPAAMDHTVVEAGGVQYRMSWGKMETVGERAVAAHLAHGDRAGDDYSPLDENAKLQWALFHGVVFEDWVDCYFGVPLD